MNTQPPTPVSELIPCRRCGKPAIMCYDGISGYRAKCSDYGCPSHCDCDTAADAAKAWNENNAPARASNDALYEALKTAITALEHYGHDSVCNGNHHDGACEGAYLHDQMLNRFRATLVAALRARAGEKFKVVANGPPCPTCGFQITRKEREPFRIEDSHA